MKTAIYCRVSTEGQEQDGTSLQTQLEACRKYCKARQYEIRRELSEAWSGLSLERPQLTELRELVRTDAIDIVVVYSLDRFSRDPVHGVINNRCTCPRGDVKAPVKFLQTGERRFTIPKTGRDPSRCWSYSGR